MSVLEQVVVNVSVCSVQNKSDVWMGGGESGGILALLINW